MIHSASLSSEHDRNASFITNTALLSWPSYTGLCIQVRFCIAKYHDEQYSRLCIALPEYLALAPGRRRAEYLAGRYAADVLLRQLGYCSFVLHKGSDGAPCWPEGICGALTHAGNTALCAIDYCDTVAGIGIDVEYLLDDKRSSLIQNTICHKREFNLLSFLQPRQRITLLFSAKESLFKAIYPHYGHYFDFHDAEMVAAKMASCRFILRLSRHLNKTFFLGRCFSGYYRFEEGKVVTIIFEALQV